MSSRSRADTTGLAFPNQEGDNLDNKTRQGYARERILKPAGSFFVRGNI